MAEVLTGNAIQLFQLKVLLSALKLETLGMKHSRGSAYATVKRQFGLTGSKAKVYAEFKAMVDAATLAAKGE